MDVGTAAVALNTLLGAVTKISKSDVTNTSVANMQQNKNNFLNENADLIKVLDANKLNSLFMVNGNMIALKKDVIVEPLLVITPNKPAKNRTISSPNKMIVNNNFGTYSNNNKPIVIMVLGVCPTLLSK